MGEPAQASSNASFAHVAALVALVLAATLPGLAVIPPVDRDEPRFAQASRQMLERGDLVDIRFRDEARHNKPAGIYWLQAATVAFAEASGVADARRAVGLYRIPSTLGAALAVLATYWAGLALVGARAAFLGAAGLAATLILAVEGRLATTDAVLLATSTVAFGGLVRTKLAALGGRTAPLPAATIALVWLAVGAGVLIKGPITPLLMALCAASLSIADRSAGWLRLLRPGLGIALAAAVAMPWLIAIGIQTGGSFFADSLGKDLLAKAAAPQESHGAPPGAFLLAAWGTFWPLAPFLAAAAPALWAARKEPEVRLILAWTIPAWAMFEAVPTKLPHYVMPLYPALALAVAWAATEGRLSPARWAKALTWLLPVGALGLTAAFAGLIWRLEGQVAWAFLAFGAAAAGLAAAAVLWFGRGRPERALALAIAASVALTAGVFGIAARDLGALFPSRAIADALPSVGCADPALAVAGYREPSLTLLTRTDLVMTDGAGAAAFLAQGGCRAALVEERQRAAFAAALGDAVPAPRLVATVKGIAINGWKPVAFGVFAGGVP